MATLTIRLPDDKYFRLKALAQSRGISIIDIRPGVNARGFHLFEQIKN